MRGADGDEDGSLADFDAAEAMDDGDAMDGEFLAHLRTDFADFGERHFFIGFVFEIERGAAAEIIAREAVEDDQRAIFGRAQAARNFVDGNGAARDFEEIRRARGLLAAAHGRQERDFIASGELRAKWSVFLID